MTRKLSLTRKKIDIIGEDIRRLGILPSLAIQRVCKLSENQAQAYLRFGEKMRLAIDNQNKALGSGIDTVTVTDTVTETDTATNSNMVTVTDASNVNPSHSFQQLTLRLYDTVTEAVTEFETKELTILTKVTDPRVRSNNAQWLLEKRFPDRYGDKKNQGSTDETAKTLIQALINIGNPVEISDKKEG